MSALVEGRYDLVPIPDVNLGPRKLNWTSPARTTRSATAPSTRTSGAADLSQPRVIGWQVVTQSPAWLAAATFPLRSETRDEYCAFDITKLVQLTAGFERALGYEF
jgi:hypothetical protein